jgi:hypothetical protein
MRGSVVAALLAAIGGAAVGRCQPCQLAPLSGERVLPGGGAVRYCPPERPPVVSGSFAVLVDDSGSMAGHRAVMGQLAGWIDRAASRLASQGLSYRESRGCYFSSRRALEACRDARLNPASFQGAAGTTLHEAVEYASRFDLSVILTDGVGNVGGGPACASGVDAACLAAALAAAVKPRPGQAAGAHAGMWLVPLVAPYQGTLYTEQAFPADQFDAQQAAANVTNDTGVAVEVGKARVTAGGLLEYPYRGPRLILAIVLAHPVELGRSFLGALVASAEFSHVRLASSLRQPSQPLSALDPIEVFPGIAPQISAFASARLGERACRTISASLAGPAVIRMDCPNAVDRGLLQLVSRGVPGGSDCVLIRSLPAQTLSLTVSDPAASPIEESRWSGSVTDTARPLQLNLVLQCRRSWSFPCPRQGFVATWRVTRDYRESAARLGAAGGGGSAEQAVISLSASSVIYQPHRLLQLRDMLEAFYRNVGITTPSTQQEVARLTVCKP